jgi:hypothetical protein
MIRKSGYGFSEKIVFSQESATGAGGSVAAGTRRGHLPFTRAAGTETNSIRRRLARHDFARRASCALHF